MKISLVRAARRGFGLMMPCLILGLPVKGMTEPGHNGRPVIHTELGQFTFATDVGRPLLTGSTTYDREHKTYMLRASGSNMWGRHDQFHAVWRTMHGDFVLRAHARFTSDGAPHRKMGWIVRASLGDDAAYADAVVSGNGMTSLQFRRAKGAQTELITSPLTAPDVIQFERRGHTFIMSVARSGNPLTRTEVSDLDLGDTVQIGLFLCAHDQAAIATASFEDVNMDAPELNSEIRTDLLSKTRPP